MSYTKGKWVVINNGGRVMLAAVGEPQIICTLETKPLKIAPETKANARLIAKSPVMADYISKRAKEGDEEAIKIINSINNA
jgi:hypothetical protein